MITSQLVYIYHFQHNKDVCLLQLEVISMYGRKLFPAQVGIKPADFVSYCTDKAPQQEHNMTKMNGSFECVFCCISV